MGAVTAAAQLALKAVDSSLVVDGFWGPRTDRAFNLASDTLRTTILGMFTSRGKVPPTSARWISKRETDAIVEAQATRLSMSPYVEALRGFLDLEARRRVTAGEISYDVNSRNGSSTGLMQMQPAAWARSRTIDPLLVEFRLGVFDPIMNISAGIAYAKINHFAIRKAGRPVNAETLYLAHNQGSGVFGIKGDVSRGYVTNFDGQSEKVRGMIRRAFDGRTPVFVGKHASW